MKKLIILTLIITPILGYSQTDVLGNTRPVTSEQWGVHRTFPGVSWRDRLPFERDRQDRMRTTRGRNDNRLFAFGRRKSKPTSYERFMRQHRRLFK